MPALGNSLSTRTRQHLHQAVHLYTKYCRDQYSYNAFSNFQTLRHIKAKQTMQQPKTMHLITDAEKHVKVTYKHRCSFNQLHTHIINIKTTNTRYNLHKLQRNSKNEFKKKKKTVLSLKVS